MPATAPERVARMIATNNPIQLTIAIVATAAPVAKEPSVVKSGKSNIRYEINTPNTMMENINPSTKIPSIIL